MANWCEKIELNQTISKLQEEFDLSILENPCPQEVKSTLATEIEKSTMLHHFGKKIRNAKSIAEVNRILNQVYDQADRFLVWCGL